jgi:hypothetical protein
MNKLPQKSLVFTPISREAGLRKEIDLKVPPWGDLEGRQYGDLGTNFLRILGLNN